MNIMVLAMGRTGHHAIIKWIANSLGGKVTLHNNCVNGWSKKELIPNKKTVHENNHGDGEHHVKSIEDFYLPLWRELSMGQWEKFDKIILVQRSPRNWLASSIAAKGWAMDYLDKPSPSIELPVTRIEAYKSYFSSSECFNIIEYDNWLISESYRCVVADMIGIKDTGIPKHCKFSSFGKNRDYNNRFSCLNSKEKKLFNRLYDDDLSYIQEGYFDGNF